MATNRYSVMPDQNLINTHVEPNYGIIDGALSRMQKAHDDAELMRQQQADQFSSVETRPISDDIAYKNELIKGYESEIEDTLKEYGGDYGAAAGNIKSIARKYAQDEFWQRNASATSLYKEKMKSRTKIEEEGGQVLSFDESVFNKALRNPDGTYNSVDGRLEKKLAWEKDADDLLKGIASDSKSGIGMSVNEKTGDVMLTNSSGEFVTPQKVSNVFRGAFVGSNSYMQMQRLAYANAKTKEEAEANLEGMMKSIEAGLISKYSFNKNKQTASFSRGPSSKGSEKDKAPQPFESKNATKVFNLEGTVPENAWKLNARHWSEELKQVAGRGNIMSDIIDWVAGKEPLVLNEKQKGALEIAKKKFNKNPKSDKEKADLLVEYTDWLQSQSVEVGFTGIEDAKTQKEKQQYLFGSGNAGSGIARDRGFKLTSGNGLKSGNGAEIMAEYPTKTFEYTVQGQYTHDTPSFPRGHSVVITNKETGREVATYDIEASASDTTPSDKFLHNAYQAKYSPDGVSTIVVNDTKGKPVKLFIQYDHVTEINPQDGKPFMNGRGKARIIDKSGKEVVGWIENGEVEYGESRLDAIQGVLKRLEEQ